MGKKNKTMMQYFHWHYPNDGSLWTSIKKEAPKLAETGITALWLPPAYKSAEGLDGVGYNTYDSYDLGEFHQKETKRTKYGTKAQYLDAIRKAHGQGMKVYADTVFNQRSGADRTEWVKAIQLKEGEEGVTFGNEDWIEAETDFTFEGRSGKYSDFKWRYYHFDGVDYANNLNKSGIFKFTQNGKDWEKVIGDEDNPKDFLTHSNLDMDHPEVRTELDRWGKWFLQISKVDGFRLDGIKHVPFSFFRNWLDSMRKTSNKEIFAVGDYWGTSNIDELNHYLKHMEGKMSLYDSPLHGNFHNASRSGDNFDMRRILDNTLMQQHPSLAVTYVENHDTLPLQSLESPVDFWFKPLAYALILLREEGYPCVFYTDFYGAKYNAEKDGQRFYFDMFPVPKLELLIQARKEFAYGKQHNFFDHKHIIGWTREGEKENPDSALAVLLSNADGGSKWMYVGARHANKIFHDFLGNHDEEVPINPDGWGEFHVNGRSVSAWVPKQN